MTQTSNPYLVLHDFYSFIPKQLFDYSQTFSLHFCEDYVVRKNKIKWYTAWKYFVKVSNAKKTKAQYGNKINTNIALKQAIVKLIFAIKLSNLIVFMMK